MGATIYYVARTGGRIAVRSSTSRHDYTHAAIGVCGNVTFSTSAEGAEKGAKRESIDDPVVAVAVKVDRKTYKAANAERMALWAERETD